MEQKIVFITGASGGIGGAAARALAEKGHRVVVHAYKHTDAGETLVKSLISRGFEAMLTVGDLADAKAVDRMFREVEETWGSVEVLIHAAGSAHSGLIQDLQDEEWQRLVADNLTSCIYTCRRAVPAMVNARSGRIILISSMWGLTGASYETAYSAMKAGVIGFSKALAKELAPSHIQVNCVAPGAVDTAMIALYDEETQALIREETPLGRIASPEEITRTIVFLCGEGGAFYTGQVLSPNGGLVI